MGSSVGGKRGIYKIKKSTQTLNWCGSVCRRSKNSIAARHAVPVGGVVFLANKGDRHLRLPVEEVRLGSVDTVLSVIRVCLTPLVVPISKSFFFSSFFSFFSTSQSKSQSHIDEHPAWDTSGRLIIYSVL